jgi:hypothetical protein
MRRGSGITAVVPTRSGLASAVFRTRLRHVLEGVRFVSRLGATVKVDILQLLLLDGLLPLLGLAAHELLQVLELGLEDLAAGSDFLESLRQIDVVCL